MVSTCWSIARQPIIWTIRSSCADDAPGQTDRISIWLSPLLPVPVRVFCHGYLSFLSMWSKRSCRRMRITSFAASCTVSVSIIALTAGAVFFAAVGCCLHARCLLMRPHSWAMSIPWSCVTRTEILCTIKNGFNFKCSLNFLN